MSWTRLDSAGESGRYAVELDEEVPGTPQDRALAVWGWVGNESRILEPARERGQRDLCLRPGQRSPEAGVDPAAKAEMLVIHTFGVEAVRVGEAAGIAVASGQGQRHG